MSEKYIVDGYCFKSEEEANIARNEIEGVEYLRTRTNYRNPQSVLGIYNKVIEKELLKTPIGYGFLKELQNILLQSEEIDDSMVKGIPVAHTGGEYKNSRKKEKSVKKISMLPEEEQKRYKNKITNLIILSVILAAALVGVIIITNNSSNVNILNYRERLEREYSNKEDELAVWDQQLRDREQKLNQMEHEQK